MTARPMVLDLSPAMSGHIATALAAHQRMLRAAGFRAPAGLADFEAMCHSRASSGQSRPPVDTQWTPPDYQQVTPRLLTYTDAAEALSVSPRTVRRLVATGSLPVVCIGDGSKRIRLRDLDEYVESLEIETSRTDVA